MTRNDATPETKAQVMQMSTSTLRDTRSGAAWIASAPAAIQSEFLDGLSPQEVRALPYLFEFWAHPHQIAPKGDWRTWVIMGGRGAGKTRAGAEWIRSRVEGSAATDPGACRRVALVGETVDQVREVMIFGESGIMACAPPDRRPAWIAGRKMLVWPNGAVAHVFSAHDPEALRGPQFDALWVDELAKWRNGRKVWDNVQLCLRLGDQPQACVTTTPRNVKVLKELLEEETTVVTRAPTQANAAYLSSTGLDHPMRAEILATQSQDWAVVAADCAGDTRAPVIFQKHMSQHMIAAAPMDWMVACRHAFLIRPPAEVAASFSAKWDGMTAEDLGFRRQAELFDHVCQLQGAAPPVVLAADVLENPAGMLQALCDALGVDWDPAMLIWASGPHADDGIWGTHWYNAVIGTTGFGSPSRRPVSVDDVLKPIIAECDPHFEAMTAHRLTAVAT